MTDSVLSLQPTPEQLCYTFGGRDPLACIHPGQLLEVGTEDCFGGLVRTVNDRPSVVCQLPFVNPVTGPFYVDGAQPGDTMAIHMVSITPSPGLGGVRDISTPRGADLNSHHRHLAAAAGRAGVALRRGHRGRRGAPPRRRGDHTVELALEPMHCTIGVAPAASEVRSTIVPDAHGGNLDTPEVRGRGDGLFRGQRAGCDVFHR